MLQPKFKIGDVVRLKSGSENMTISKVYYKAEFKAVAAAFMGRQAPEEPKEKEFTGSVECSWHDSKGKPMFRNYHQDMLDLVTTAS